MNCKMTLHIFRYFQMGFRSFPRCFKLGLASLVCIAYAIGYGLFTINPMPRPIWNSTIKLHSSYRYPMPRPIWNSTPRPIWNSKNKLNSSYRYPNCKVPYIDPWDKSIDHMVRKKPVPYCPHKPQLTYMDGQWLRINHTIINEKYLTINLSCSYQTISRNGDRQIILGKPVQLDIQKGAKIIKEFIKVRCHMVGAIRAKIYENFHVQVLDTENNGSEGGHISGVKNSKWNVMLISTDSLSHSSSIRYLPKTRHYLLKQLKAVELHGYTKVGKNTFPNMIPFLTGKNVEDVISDKKKPMDYLPLIFKNYSRAGYKTIFSEDDPGIALFNFNRPGFQTSPTDYYFRPLALAMKEQLAYERSCEDRLAMQRLMMEYLHQFVKRFRNQNHFSYTCFTKFSHDYQSESQWLDQLYFELFLSLEEYDIWNNTILVFFADHGPRWGAIMQTYVGKMEGKLPMMYIALPDAFRAQHPNLIANLQFNSDLLTNAFDMHKTLLHILDIDQEPKVDLSLYGQSLFTKIPLSRSCKSAGVQMEFCTCLHEKKLNTNESVIVQAARFLVNRMNADLKTYEHICHALELINITSALEVGETGSRDEDGDSTYQVTFTTRPGDGNFEGTVTADIEKKSTHNHKFLVSSSMKVTFQMQGPISRLNKYGSQANCMKEPVLEPYCYCRNQ